jgi:hypothetical protein
LAEKDFAMLRSFLLPAMLITFAATADAQTIVINPNKSGVLPSATTSVEPVRITVGVSTFAPAPNGDSEQALKAQEDGRRMIYAIAGRECAIMSEVVASDCHLESININVQRVGANRNFNEPRGEGFNINGNISYRIVPK